MTCYGFVITGSGIGALAAVAITEDHPCTDLVMGNGMRTTVLLVTNYPRGTYTERRGRTRKGIVPLHCTF